MEYKGYYIEYNLYGKGEYTVQFCGDDFWFTTEKEAKDFIDKEVTEWECEAQEGENYGYL